MTSAMSDQYDEFNTALQLPEDTIREAQGAVARNEPLKEYLRESGAGNNTDIIRRFANNPDSDPVDNLGPVHGQRFAVKRRAASIPKPRSPQPGQSLGAFLLGK